MIQDSFGAICRDPTVLRLKAEDLHLYDYVHSPMRWTKPANAEDDAEPGMPTTPP